MKKLLALALLASALLFALWNGNAPDRPRIGVDAGVPATVESPDAASAANDVPGSRVAADPMAAPASAPPAADPAVATEAHEPWTQEVIVVDEGQTPVPGALVEMFAATTHRTGPLAGRWNGKTGDRLQHAFTRGDGRIAFQPTADTVVLVASDPPDGTGVRRRSGSFRAERTSAGQARLVLVEPIHLVGRVLEADGRPASGVTVSARPNPLASSFARIRIVPESVVTGEDGRFRLEVHRNSQFELEGRRGTSRTPTRPIDIDSTAPSEITLRFPGSCTLRGVVVDPFGGPARDATVHAVHVPERGVTSILSHQSRGLQCTTAADGSFVLEGPEHGEWRLQAGHANHANATPVTVRTSFEQPEANGMLVLRERSQIAGVVVDENDAPLHGLRIELRADLYDGRSAGRPASEGRFGLVSEVVTDADGRFAVAVHPDTQWSVVTHLGGSPGADYLVTPGVAPGTNDLRIVVTEAARAGCSLRVTLVDEHGGPLPYAVGATLMQWWQNGNGQSWPRVTVQDGEVRVDALPLGATWTLELVPPRIVVGKEPPALPTGSGPRAADTLYVERAEDAPVALAPRLLERFVTDRDRLEFRVEFRRYGRLTAQLLDANGAPVHGIELVDAPPQRLSRLLPVHPQSDADGRVEWKAAQPGLHTVRAVRGGETIAESQVDVPPDGHAHVVLRTAN